MRIRKVAKQLKRYHKSFVGYVDDMPVHTYKVRGLGRKMNFILRITRRNYFGVLRKRKQDCMLRKLAIHKACSPYLYEDIMEFWGVDLVG